MSELGIWLDRWALTLDSGPMRTPSGVIAFVRRNNERAVLKLVNAGNDEERSPAILRLWDGDHAVRLLAWEGRASLLERAVPGTPLEPLVAAGDDGTATGILADAMLALRRSNPPPGDWPTTETWADGIARQRKRGDHPLLPAVLLDRGEGVFRELSRDASELFFLHGDLHHTNVLFDEARGWLTIDPKGVVGNAAFEAAMALANPVGLHPLAADRAVVAHRVAIYCERLGFDRKRVLGWAFAQTVLSACWHIEDGDTDDQIAGSLAVANTARALLTAG